MGVPRVYEKIEEKLREVGAQNGFIKQKIANWAKSLGNKGTYAEYNTDGKAPICWGLAKSLVFNNVKKALGLNNLDAAVFGAAPMNPITRSYFLSLNMFLINGYGLSETAGSPVMALPWFIRGSR